MPFHGRRLFEFQNDESGVRPRPTGRGGSELSVASAELGLPIRYVGIGEQVDDLMVFDAENYVNSLFN